MMKVLLAAVAAVIILGGGYFFLKGSGPADTGSSVATANATTTDAQSSDTALSQASSTAAASTQPGTYTVEQEKHMTATLHTNMGDITVEFYPDQAPKTVANFIKLAQEGFYNGTKFHRVIKGFMDQGGDPLTKDDSKAALWGTGGPGYTIPDEFGTTYTNTAGTLAMANTGQPNSGGSQFFINAIENHFLDGKYAVFGKVTSGMDVVTKINDTPTNPSNDRPLTPVVLESVTVQQ